MSQSERLRGDHSELDTESLADRIRRARVSRRAVLKAATLSGTSAFLAACGTATQPSPGASTAASSAPSQAPASQAASPAAARGGTIRMGAFEGGLTDGFLPWKSFGQEFAWN